MKKIIPAIALMFVLAATFAFRPAEKATTLATKYLINDPVLGWTPSNVPPATSCTGTGQFCYIEYNDADFTPSEAQDAVEGFDHDKNGDYTIQDANPEEQNDQTIFVHVRS